MIGKDSGALVRKCISFPCSGWERIIGRFPLDFMFQLTAEERAEVVANYAHLSKLKFLKTLPYAFTKHGAININISK